ncbi:peptide-methionine (S)-S-oxide reductase [Portibacter lacus]|uniref:peptide-methionine (S)-S-oxide reductase n=1 Tax=Portibacter lacus TaxID=1099794 RepID=A0AA37SQ25_9BACT|nr:peptide-methionine (S)-S-oxide reductase [Portibacter lacus]GLR17482.1 peptide methionine sulfoxide reductase MsrA [Portibacter lacus]
MEVIQNKIGFGGGCHWCTEAVFQHVDGVVNVQQGWIASESPNDALSEAVIVHFDEGVVSRQELIRIHIHTHSSTASHPMRGKYRSAVYYFQDSDSDEITRTLQIAAKEFSEDLITQVLPFKSFKENSENYQSYFLKNPDKAFCQRYILPKLKKLETL